MNYFIFSLFVSSRFISYLLYVLSSTNQPFKLVTLYQYMIFLYIFLFLLFHLFLKFHHVKWFTFLFQPLYPRNNNIISIIFLYIFFTIILYISSHFIYRVLFYNLFNQSILLQFKLYIIIVIIQRKHLFFTFLFSHLSRLTPRHPLFRVFFTSHPLPSHRVTRAKTPIRSIYPTRSFLTILPLLRQRLLWAS